MLIKIVPIKIEDKNVLEKMVMDYQKELLGQNAGEYKYLNSYWEESDRFPYFIKVDGIIAGFALVNSYNLVIDDGKNIAEFYVKKEFRKSGVGKEAARQIYKLFPGKWESRQMKSNPAAHAFRLKVVSELTNGNFKEIEVNNDKWHGWIQTFEMNGNPS